MLFKTIACSLITLTLTFVTTSADPGEKNRQLRAMWVWSTRTIAMNDVERMKFLDGIAAAKITDVFLFLRADDYTAIEPALRKLLVKLRQLGIHAWGMEGWRGYFSDVEGPVGLYRAADAMIVFNQRNAVRFIGFHSDIEFHDDQADGKIRFHNGLAESKLTPTQHADRDGILTEWLSMHATLSSKARAANITYSAAIPSWLDDYEGEPLTAIHEGARKDLMHHLMLIVQDYVIMSYNTNPANVIRRISSELTYADSLRERHPRILFGMETHAGAGVHVSYADTPPKNSKAAVLADYNVISRAAAAHSSFAGGAIHDWEGWQALP